eukprot:2772391-Pyramimonas_sp.AAC.1
MLWAPGVVVDAVDAEDANILKFYIFQGEWGICCFWRRSQDSSWGTLGPSWELPEAVLEPSS